MFLFQTTVTVKRTNNKQQIDLDKNHTTLMKNLKLSDYNRICRLCLKIGNNLNKLLTITEELSEKICIVTSVEIKLNDEFPRQICTNCCKTVNKYVEFREFCAKKAEMLNLHFLIHQDEEPEDLPVEIDDSCKIELTDPKIASEPEILDDTFCSINNVRKSTRNRKLTRYLCAIKKFKDLADDDSCNEKREKKDVNIIICDKCSAPIKSFLLEYHFNEHNQIYPFSCTECDKQFSSPYKLKRHKFGVHKYAQEIKCPDCGITVKGTQNLQRHKRNVHLKEYRSMCTICNMKFSTSESCKRHSMIHSNIKPFECGMCTAKFRTKSNLNTHLRIHTNEKPFKCEICDAHFTYNAALKKHVQEHVHDNVNVK